MTLFLVVVVLKSAAQELNCKFTVRYEYAGFHYA